MPTLDRRITVAIEGPGARDANGRYVPGVVTTSTVWASKLAAVLDRSLDSDGQRVDGTAVYRVRWTAVLAAAEPAAVTLTADGRSWRATVIREADGRRMTTGTVAVLRTRRRWIDIEVLEATS